MDQIKDKAIASFFWKLLERGGNQIVALLVQIVMARLLAPSDFGALAILLVVVNIGNILSQSGLNSSLVQAEKADEVDYSTVLWLSLTISVVLYGAIFACAPLLATLYDLQIIEPALRVISLLLPVSAANAVLVAFNQRILNFKAIFKSTIAATLVSGFLGVASALAGAGLWALIVQQIAYALTNGLTLAFQAKWLPSITFSTSRARAHFRFGWKILVPTLLETGYDSLSDMVVGKQFGATSLGYLSQGKKYPLALDSIISGTLQPVLFSTIARLQDDVSSVKSAAKRTLKTAFFFVFPIMFTFAVSADSIVDFLLGAQWAPAVPFMQLYCITSALASFHSINFQTYNGIGRSDLYLKVKVITVSYGVLLMLFACFIVRDILAVAIAYVVSSVISTFVNSVPTGRLIGYKYFEQLRDIAPFFVISFVSVALAFPIGFFNLPSLPTVAVQWVVSIGAYVSICKLLNLEELDYLLSIVKKRISKSS